MKTNFPSTSSPEDTQLVQQVDFLSGSTVGGDVIVDTFTAVGVQYTTINSPADIETHLAEVQAQRLNDAEVTAELATYIPVQASLELDDEQLFDLEQSVADFLRSDKRALLLLGDSGSGKSLFNQYIERKLWESYEPGGVIPLLINLPAMPHPEQGVVESQLKRLGFGPEPMHELKATRQLVIILDGYDEIRTDKNLYVTNHLAEWQAKVITACRSQYLQTDLSQYRRRFMPQYRGKFEPSWFEQRVIHAFTPPQIDAYLQKYVAVEQPIWSDWRRYRQQLASLSHLAELIQNPFILHIVVEVLPEIAEKYRGQQNSQQLTRRELYATFIERLFDRQVFKLEEQGLVDDSWDIKADFYDFSRRLASSMLRLGANSIHYVPQQRSRTQQGLTKQDFAEFFANDDETCLIRSGCPLKKIGPQDYAFIHKSLLEYFGSESLVASFSAAPAAAQHPPLAELPLDDPANPAQSISYQSVSQALSTLQLTPQQSQSEFAGHELNQRLLNDEPSVVDFLVDALRQGDISQAQLLEIVQRSKTEAGVAIAAANAMTILNRAGVNFSGMDLRGVRIAGANLSGALLDSTQLQGADLSNVQLVDSFLYRAQLQGSQLSGTELGQLPYLKTGSEVQCIAYSPDGHMLASGIWDKTVRLWRVRDGTLLATLQGHTDGVYSISFSPDGQLLASGSMDKTVRLWRVRDGAPLATLQGCTGWVQSVSFSPDGQMLASGSEDNTVRLWRVRDGALLSTLQGHADGVYSVNFSPDGQLLASGSLDNTVRLWRVRDGAPLLTLQGHTSWVYSVSFSPDGQMLASGSNDNTVRLWRVRDGAPLPTLQGHTDRVNSVSFSPDGQLLASGSLDNTVRLWRVRDGAPLPTLQGHTDGIYSVSFSPDGQMLASGSYDNTVRLWRVRDGAPLPTLQGHTHWVRSVSFSPDGQLLASGSRDKTVRLWRVRDGAPFANLQGHNDRVQNVSFSPDGQLLASGSSDNTVRLWRVRDGTPLPTLQGCTGWVNSVSFSSDGQLLASGSRDKTVRLWRVRDGVPLPTLQGHTDEVNSVSFSQDGQLLASGSSDKTVRLWRVRDGAPLATLQGYTSGVNSVSFSPDGQLLASGSSDKTVRLWQVRDGAPLATLQGHTSVVYSVSFSPDGQLLASGSMDKTVRLWRVRDGAPLATLQGHTSVVNSVSFSPDGQWLASGSWDNSIQVWQLRQDSYGLSAQLSWSTHRYLTAQQANVEGAMGLSASNVKLLKQLGAVSEPPVLTLQASPRASVASGLVAQSIFSSVSNQELVPSLPQARETATQELSAESAAREKYHQCRPS
jgi:WD40 repeat protein